MLRSLRVIWNSQSSMSHSAHSCSQWLQGENIVKTLRAREENLIVRQDKYLSSLYYNTLRTQTDTWHALRMPNDSKIGYK